MKSKIIISLISIYILLGLIAGLVMRSEFNISKNVEYFKSHETIYVADGGTQIVDHFGYLIVSYNKCKCVYPNGKADYKIGYAVECKWFYILIIPIWFQLDESKELFLTRIK